MATSCRFDPGPGYHAMPAPFMRGALDRRQESGPARGVGWERGAGPPGRRPLENPAMLPVAHQAPEPAQAAATAMAAMLVAAFYAGRHSQTPVTPVAEIAPEVKRK